MKRRDKQQILELICTLEEANIQLLSTIEKAADEGLITILSDEQAAAISIGNRIEELEGEGTEAVGILEKYCETLWQISQETELIRKKQGIEQLLKLIHRERDEINDIHETLDVVFLPYKASMWDCMETVWKAADEDPDCNAYVIPIPYFDLNPDRTAGEMHYEADLMPDYVPIVSFQEYNLEKEHPDIIYIHNPYDEYNKVTSVHPDFYSSVIRNYTDMLVYIPYFITSGRLPESHSHLPAYVYADKVILQNEEMIEDVDENIPREKLLPLGSPKEERLIWMETHKEQIDFPEEWKRRANGRKVILYNVSISGLLKDRDKILNKMEEVFSLVSKRDDIVLLLRPHPLLEATLTSMCEDLLEKYKKLMRYFKKHNIGILDQTPDPDKAVVFADAYMGEASSSIVEMFRVLNKPRFFLTEKRFYQMTLDEMKSERMLDVCRAEDELWFVTHYLQLLCKLNLRDDKIEVMAEIPETHWGEHGKYISVVKYEDKLILTPYRADALCVCNVTTKRITKHYFKDEFVDIRFGKAFLWEHFLFLIPMDYPAIVRYDIVEDIFDYNYQCVADVLKLSEQKEQDFPYLWAACNYKEKLFVASKHSNVVLQFNMNTCNYSVFKVGNDTNSYRGITANQDYCWLIKWDDPNVVRWNRTTGETKEFDKFPSGFEAGIVPFRDIVDFENELYMVPCHANHICKLDKGTGNITFAEFELPYDEGDYQSEFYAQSEVNYDFAKKMSEKEMIVLSLYDDSLIILDISKKSCRKIPVRIDNYLIYENRKKGQNLRSLWESKDQPISKYLEYVANDLFDTNKRCGVYNTRKFITDEYVRTGDKIHSHIKKLIIFGG